MKQGIARSIFANTVYNYMGSIIISILSFVTLLYLTRNFSIEQFGQYNLVLSTQAFFVSLISMGLPSVILRFVPECIVKNDYIAARRIIFYSSGILFIVGVIAAIPTFALQHILRNFSQTLPFLKYILVALFLGLVRAEVRLLETAFCAFLNEGYRIFFEIMGSVLKLLLFAVSIRMGAGVVGAILSVGIVDIFLIFVYSLRMRLYLKLKTTGSVKIVTQRLISYGAKEYSAKLMSFFCDMRIDAYFIAVYLGAVPTGIFFFVIGIVSMISEYMPGSVMQSSSQVVFARQFYKSGNYKELKYLFALNNKLKAFFVFPVFIGFILLSDKIVAVFFKNYFNAVKLFPIILAFMLFYIFLIPLRNIVATLEKNEITLISSMVFLYKIPAAFFLTKNFGLTGAAFSAGSTIFLYYLIHLCMTKRLLTIHYPWKAFFTILINSLIGAVLLITLRPYITGVFSLCAAIAVFVCAYFAASFLNKAFNDYDRQILNKPFFKPLWNF